MNLSDDELRRLLDREAGSVEFAPDSLGEIRRRIKARSRWWLMPWLPRAARALSAGMRHRGGAMFAISTGTGAAVAATVVAVVVGIGSCSPAPNAPVTTGTAPATSAPTGGGSPTPATTQTSVTVALNVPIYYIGTVDGADRLYREYHRLSGPDKSAGSQVTAALTEMFRARAANPGYVTMWPAGTRLNRPVTVSGGVATVDLHGATVNADDPDGNRAAIQQLVWTATAYSGAKGVRLLFDGKSLATVWKSKQKVGGTLTRAAAVDTLAPVWIIDPQARATVPGNVTFNLAGIVFEGTIQLRILDHAGKVETTKVVQLTVGAPAQGTASLRLTLKPGTYTAEAYFVSLKDGSRKGIDRHPFTVG